MSEFKREHRYHVLKIAHLTDHQNKQLAALLASFYDQGVDPLIEAVVVEHDWPIYEQTWDAVQRLAEGRIQELDELRANAAERERLKMELAATLGYDAPKPSMCDLVAEASLLRAERDGLAALFVRLQDGATDLIHAASEEEAGDAMELIAECSEKEARNMLAQRDAEQREKALTETAKWFAALHTRTELLSAEVVFDILMDQSRRQTEGHQ